jgi:UDP-N-acetylmuramoyl-L-alanyl-D-glutamate--2,6-diaminopimelate ligase
VPTVAAMAKYIDAELFGDGTVSPAELAYDSRQVACGDMFICWSGAKFDGHEFAAESLAKGAVALVCERRLEHLGQVPQIVVGPGNIRTKLGDLSAFFYGFPSRQLDLIGVTGTNGKTTSTFLIKSILQAAGMKVGLIGTINNYVDDTPLRTSRTTPEAPDLQRLLAQMVKAGCNAAVMEVSSHGIALHRLDGCEFQVGLFTNLTQDHLDYHQTMENYRQTKGLFFKTLKKKAVINADDPNAFYYRRICQVPEINYGINNEDCDIKATDVHSSMKGVSYKAHLPMATIDIQMELAGLFNVYNSLGAIGTALHFGADRKAISEGLACIQVPGRFEKVDLGQPFTVIVDYAHTPDGLENVLKSAREATEGRVIAVFGAGGDRDRSKRPIMGEIGAKLADRVIITSDNPRTEDPLTICKEVAVGADKVQNKSYDLIVDRREAICYAINLAKPQDTVVIAGKGHETYQEINGEQHFLDDRIEAGKAIEERMRN